MKNKHGKTKRQRQTVAKKIAKLPLPLAQQVARHGRTLHPIEAAAVEYLDALDFTRRCRAHKEIENAKVGAAACAQRWEWLEFEVLAAVQDGDGDALRTLARFVEKYQYNDPDEDTTRRTLLSMKGYHRQGGRRITAKEIGERWLHYPKDADLSRLRAIGKEVGYPFAPDAVGRPRKTQTRKRVLKA